jgi:hypothetical protein
MHTPKQTYAELLHPLKYGYRIHHYGHHYGVLPPPPTTTPSPPPPPPPKRRRVGYYYIGRKLYLVPAVFAALFLPYILSFIVKSVVRHKIHTPYDYWVTGRQIGWDVNEIERLMARVLEAVEKRYN